MMENQGYDANEERNNINENQTESNDENRNDSNNSGETKDDTNNEETKRAKLRDLTNGIMERVADLDIVAQDPDDCNELIAQVFWVLSLAFNYKDEKAMCDMLETTNHITSTNNDLRANFIELGLVPFLIPCMDEEGQIQQLALKIIRTLSLVSLGRESLVHNKAVRKLVALTTHTDPIISCCALRATFNLSVVNERIRQEIVHAGALSKLLEASLEESDGQCAAIGTLANLATEPDIKRAIVQDHDGLGPLLKLLESTDESILTHACRALFAIAANDENKISIAKAGGLPLLLSCMDWPSDSVRMNAAGALANLAIHPVNKLKLVKFGALNKLRGMAMSANIKIQRQVARCLFALAAHVENRKAIIVEKCLPSLVRLLNSSNPDVQLNAAGAIGNIAMTDEYKQRVVESGALDRLVELSGIPVDRVQRQAARAIFTLTAKDVAKTKLV